jgi:hypothetical protein
MPDHTELLSLLYAGPQAAVCRTPGGDLVVRAHPGEDDQVVMTPADGLARGLEALLRLAA